MARLYKELENYGKNGSYPFHMPGHKRNKDSVDGEFPFERDITEISGFDNLHHAEGIIREAQEEVSALYGTKESFFCVNGSTAALLAAISASVKKGGHILIARNCHKAVYNGIYLRNLVPTYIYPQVHSGLGINGVIDPARVERALEEDKELEAVLITSPTYDGVVSDVQKIAEIAHRHGIPLIVDEAHGPHFRFSEYFPDSAVDLGADLVIHSFHKTLPAMTQTSVLHLCSDRISGESVQRFLGIYQTSSPSYILMGSLDACVDRLQRQGTEMFREFTENLEGARRMLADCRKIRLVTPEMLKADGAERQDAVETFMEYDRSKLIFSTRGSSLNGPELAQILREEFQIEVEMEAEDYVLALAAVGDTEEGFRRLTEAIRTIDERECRCGFETKQEEKEIPENISMKQRMTISDAMDAETTTCLIEESVGRISAEFVYLYPPGIPVLVPGEQITGLFVRNMRRYEEQGLNLQGLSDYENKKIRVVK